MTIKGKKTGSLPKMTREQIDRFSNGGWVDESIPEDDVRAVAGLPDPDAFVAFLGPRVGRYRSAAESDHVPVADELAWTETTMEVIQELRTRLKNYPQHIKAEAGLAHWKRHKELLHDANRRMDAYLNELWTVLAIAERAVEPHGGKAGRKTNWARDSLLTDIADWIEKSGAAPDAAARISRKVLVALGIPDPDKPATVIRAYKQRLEKARAGRGEIAV